MEMEPLEHSKLFPTGVSARQRPWRRLTSTATASWIWRLLILAQLPITRTPRSIFSWATATAPSDCQRLFLWETSPQEWPRQILMVTTTWTSLFQTRCHLRSPSCLAKETGLSASERFFSGLLARLYGNSGFQRRWKLGPCHYRWTLCTFHSAPTVTVRLAHTRRFPPPRTRQLAS